MDIRTIMAAIFIAVAFAAWPVVGKYSQASGGWLGTIVMIGTAGAVFLLSFSDVTSNPIPTGRALLFLAGAAVINGVGVWMYSVKSADPTVPTGTLVSIVFILGVMIAPLMDLMLNGEQLTIRKLAGLGFAGFAIYLLSK